MNQCRIWLRSARVISLCPCRTKLVNCLSGFFLCSSEARIRFLCPTAVMSNTLISSTSHSFITRSIVSKFLFMNVSVLSPRCREFSHSLTEGGRLSGSETLTQHLLTNFLKHLYIKYILLDLSQTTNMIPFHTNNMLYSCYCLITMTEWIKQSDTCMHT